MTYAPLVLIPEPVSALLLLVGLPFVLSRERNIKASAGLTGLMVGAAYILIHFAR